MLALFYVTPTNIYQLKGNNRIFRKRCEICSNLTIRHQNDVNDVTLRILLLTLNIFPVFFGVYIVDFERVNVCRVNLVRR